MLLERHYPKHAQVSSHSLVHAEKHFSHCDLTELQSSRSIRRERKSRTVALTSWGCSIGAVCEALGISRISAPGTAAAIARERSGGVKPSRPPATTSVGTATPASMS